ncbi:MAG: four helix bundle protein [Candidatus Marinimicrobia bacterium]|nr:four helix bundle protein [Candidatus Neomarinimicrobiota bacterium]RKY55639.1 MAG: four helix bundle protein [Candidatus Neomarinimicrobiota bacterium]
MKNVYELDVYQLAEKLSDMIWIDYENWDIKVKNTIGPQIIRASDSIAVNIAEGFGRYTPADRRKFYRYSRGSFEETKAWLRKLFRRKIINAERQNEYSIVINELGPKLNAFINKTK